MINTIGNNCVIVSDNRKIIQLSQNGRKYIGNNHSRKIIIQFCIDGNLPSRIKQCDNAIGIPVDNIIIFIEFKGSDLGKAAEQILSTIEYYNPNIKRYSISARIILSRVQSPDLRSTSYRKLMQKITEKKGNLLKSSSVLVDDL